MRGALLLWATLPVATLAADFDFRVTLDGAEIGRHRFRVERGDDEVRVVSEASFAVRFLFIDAWRYSHRAEERWRGDCLTALDARTQANGGSETVTARLERSGLVVASGNAREFHGRCEMTFAYWNPAILAARRLLNAQTGELMEVTIRPLGEEPFPLRGRPVAARRHRIEGRDLAIDLWYAGGAWIGLESSVAGGRRLRYELS